MSVAVGKDANKQCCASCGIAGGDDVKLKDCSACHLVKYCSVKCQKDHWPQHKKECKGRVAELRDEILFKQPESSHLGDCPICYLPLSIDKSKYGYVSYSCCSKRTCAGCDYNNHKRESQGRLQHSCPFCRKAAPGTGEEINEQWMKRIEANDPFAMRFIGTIRYKQGDYKAAFGYWTRAADLGDVEAHYQLSNLYRGEKQVVEKDQKMELYHTEQAAIGGHPRARHNLACLEGKNGRADRAGKHFIIAAKLGFGESLERVKGLYKVGLISKDDFAAALRGHQAAIAATKSPQREEAAKFVRI